MLSYKTAIADHPDAAATKSAATNSAAEHDNLPLRGLSAVIAARRERDCCCANPFAAAAISRRRRVAACLPPPPPLFCLLPRYFVAAAPAAAAVCRDATYDTPVIITPRHEYAPGSAPPRRRGRLPVRAPRCAAPRRAARP